MKLQSEGGERLEVQNDLSISISSYDDESRYDAACKKLLANKQILARILKNCVKEFEDCNIKDIEQKYIEGTPEISAVLVHQDVEFIEGMSAEDTSKNEGTVTFDIRFYAYSPIDNGLIRLIINVEAQNSFNPGYPIVKRGIYYGSRMISSQHGTVFDDQHYEKIEKVYSIWVCPNPPATRRNSIAEYSIGEKILVGQTGEKAENYDLMSIILICLGGSVDINYDGIIKMLDVLLSDRLQPDEKKRILHDDFDIEMTKELESEVARMCNLSQGVIDRATVNHVISMMKNMNMDMDKCFGVLDIPESQWAMYRQKIEEELRLQPA